ncbi:hypothetical protein AML46_09290 [Escherichia coli]|nr:hypothetical protein AML46_09290 [Escherichia coli]GIP92288.1 hypothetical protein EC07E033_31620 [Escherichia coli]
MFWNPEVITTTGKSLRITQIQFNIIYIMRTVIAVIDKTKRCPVKSSAYKSVMCKSGAAIAIFAAPDST